MECTPVGKVSLLGPALGGHPYGLSLLLDLLNGAATLIWRLIVGRGRWKVVVTDRDSGEVLDSWIYRNRRVAETEGIQRATAKFG